MIKLYPVSFRKTTFLLAILTACSLSLFASGHFTGVDTVKSRPARFQVKPGDTVKNKLYRPNTSAPIKITFSPFKPPVIKANTISSTPTSTKDTPVQAPEDKSLSIKVYPNPVEDQINFSYRLSKESSVTFKVMDMLGNELITLLSQKLAAGDQVNTFYVGSKLHTGVYFIRVIIDKKSTIKRISVL